MQMPGGDKMHRALKHCQHRLWEHHIYCLLLCTAPTGWGLQSPAPRRAQRYAHHGAAWAGEACPAHRCSLPRRWRHFGMCVGSGMRGKAGIFLSPVPATIWPCAGASSQQAESVQWLLITSWRGSKFCMVRLLPSETEDGYQVLS